MLKTSILPLISLLSLALVGCAAAETRHPESASAAAPGEGISYNLAQARFTLTVVEAGGGVNVTLGGPRIIADDDARMETRLPHNGGSDDNVTINVDADNLLSKVEITSVGQVAAIAANLVRDAAFLQGAESVQGTVIYQGEFGVNDAQRVVDEANAQLRNYYRRDCTTRLSRDSLRFQPELHAAGYSNDDADKAVRDRLLRCRSLADAGLDANPATNLISLTFGAANAAAAAPATTQASPPVPNYSECLRGVCYRPLRLMRFTLRIGTYYSLSDSFLVPDLSRLMFVDLSAGVFATQKYTLTFTRGALTSYQQDGHSELVGLTRLPGDLVAGLISGPAEVLGLRQSRLTAETNYLNTVRTNVDAQTQAATTCHTNPTACPGSAYRLIRVPLSPPQSASDNPQSTEHPDAKDDVPNGGG